MIKKLNKAKQDLSQEITISTKEVTYVWAPTLHKAEMKLSLPRLMGNTQGFNIGGMWAQQTDSVFLGYLRVQIAVSLS